MKTRKPSNTELLLAISEPYDAITNAACIQLEMFGDKEMKKKLLPAQLMIDICKAVEMRLHNIINDKKAREAL